MLIESPVWLFAGIKTSLMHIFIHIDFNWQCASWRWLNVAGRRGVTVGAALAAPAEKMSVEQLYLVDCNAHFHLFYIILYLKIAQIHLNSQQSVMPVTKNTPLSKKQNGGTPIMFFHRNQNKITNVQQLATCFVRDKVCSSLQSINSIKEIIFWPKSA